MQFAFLLEQVVNGLVLGDAVPVPADPLEGIYPTKAQNPCEMKA